MVTHTLHIKGMHCPSCVILNEEALSKAPGVISVKVDLGSSTVTLTGELPTNASEAAALLSPLMPASYSLSTESTTKKVIWSEFYYALPIAALLVVGFFALQKTGLVSVNLSEGITLGTALIIGLVASISTCLAVVGGLVLSVGTAYTKTGDRFKPQLGFHIGRLLGFFILGGVLGALGQSLKLGLTGNLILTSVVALIMLILGLNLLDIFSASGKFQLRLPKQFSSSIHKLKNSSHVAMPVILGIATFFLPCGFTQSMQVVALSTGGFIAGGLTMLIFALGTLPVLALLSFSAFSITSKPWRGVFFKTAGLIVIALATINLLGALAVAGIIEPIF